MSALDIRNKVLKVLGVLLLGENASQFPYGKAQKRVWTIGSFSTESHIRSEIAGKEQGCIKLSACVMEAII